MRVLFAVAGGPSHLYPLVPLAWAFRTAGHEVRLVGKAGSAETMLCTGLSIVTLGGPPMLSPQARKELVDTAYDQPPWPADWPAHPGSLASDQVRLLEGLGRYTVAVADGMADQLVAYARQWRPDLIVHDTLALSAVIAGALLDVPCFRYTHGTQDVFRVEYSISGDPLPEYVGMFGRFGIDPPAGPPHYVDTVPPSMFVGAERPCVDMRYVPYNGPGTEPDGLRGPRQRPRVCVTWGMVVPAVLGSAAADPYRDVIAAIADAGAEVLVLAGAAQLSSLDTPPPGVRYIAGAPLYLVLPQCDAIVHHGGEGSAMAAACLAVPHLVITREPLDDQSGGRLARTGAAIHLRYQHLAQDPAAGQSGIRDAIDKLLSDNSYADAAARLRDDIERQPAPASVAATLAALRNP
jgi:glycosyltransferase